MTEQIASVAILPVRDMDEAVAFWSSVPYLTVEEYPGGGYAFVRYGDADVVHLGHFPDVDLATNRAGCIVLAPCIDTLRDECTAAGLPVSETRDEPWGLREFRLTDPSGNVMRVGCGDEHADSCEPLS